MRRLVKRVGTALVALGVAVSAGCTSRSAASIPTITCLGDSTTLGVTRSSDGGTVMAKDPLGGWPGRLARRLGDRARVVNRGLGGSTTSLWLTSPAGVWRGTAVADFLRGNHWNDLAAPPDGLSLAEAVVRTDRPSIVVVLLGGNDLVFDPPDRDPDTVAETIGRLRTLRAQALSVAPAVVISTVLVDRRHPPETTEALNAAIRAAFPDYLPLGEDFLAAGGTALLGDEVHPSEAGYEVIAEAAARELEARGLVPSESEQHASRAAGVDDRASAW